MTPWVATFYHELFSDCYSALLSHHKSSSGYLLFLHFSYIRFGYDIITEVRVVSWPAKDHIHGPGRKKAIFLLRGITLTLYLSSVVSFLKRFTYFYLYVCDVCLFMYICHMYVDAHRSQSRVTNLLELELQVVVTLLTCVLENQLQSPKRAALTFEPSL